jgi:hypothetical protein
MVFGLIFWSLWMYGQIIDWWIPYFYGVSEDKMVQYQKMYGATYSFFQTQHNYPAPDACHTILHLLTFFVLLSGYRAYMFGNQTITFYSTFIGIFAGLALLGFFAYMTHLANEK